MCKNIVLCFDGTKENFGPQPYTNVLKIYRLLDTTNQMCYYQPGIGTAADFDSADDLKRRFTWSTIKNTLDSMFAFHLDDHITSAYLYLMRYYERGDSIFMFGFSRGAFLARVLAGMIERVGLLNKGLDDMVGMAWRIYESWEFAEQPSQADYTTTLIEEFKRIFSRDYEIKIHFQGLFDSVNSVGLLREKLFPCTQRSNIVDHVRHGISVDERRGKFKQLCFTPNPYKPELFSLNYKSYIRDIDSPDNVSVPYSLSSLSSSSIQTRMDKLDNPLISYTLQRWVGIYIKPDSNDVLTKCSLKRKGSAVSLWNRFFNYKNDTIENTIPQDMHSKYILNQKVNNYLLIANPKGSRNIQCSNKHIEGIFELQHSRNIMDFGQAEAMFASTSSLRSDKTLTPDLVEKWFPGDHCDVGGGWAPDHESQTFASNISLRWMLAESIKNGVKFKPGVIHKFAAKYTSLSSLCSSNHDYLRICCDPSNKIPVSISNFANRHSQEINMYYRSELEVQDPTFDDISKELFSSKYGRVNKCMVFIWWLLEFLPIGIRIESSDGKWRNIYVPNLGRHRCIPKYADMHWSVFWRIKYNEKYRPQNLPNYVYEILEQCNSTSHSENDVLSKISPINSSINHNDTNIISALPFFQTSIQTVQSDEELFSGLINTNYYETLNNVLEWEETMWHKVPDDLIKLLNSNPSL